MLIITTRLAGRLKSVFRQALALPTRGPMPPVQLVGGAHGLRIRCRMREAACEFLLDGEQPTEMIVAPGELLADVEGRREQPVELRVQNGRVLASWRDGSVPQTVRHECRRFHRGLAGDARAAGHQSRLAVAGPGRRLGDHRSG